MFALIVEIEMLSNFKFYFLIKYILIPIKNRYIKYLTEIIMNFKETFINHDIFKRSSLSCSEIIISLLTRIVIISISISISII